jgi:hypothetical protein
VTEPTLELRADCASCAGLCCVVPAFAVSADFALDKPARTPCPHLALGQDVGHGCTIHRELPERGFPGCTVYDCFGAGQRVVREHGATWTPELFAAFEAVERLHELLWYLEDALDRPQARPLADELLGLRAAVLAAAEAPHAADVPALQGRADPLLGEVSGLVRRGSGGEDLRGRDLVGQDLRERELAGASLRGALLLGADLRGCDLDEADVLGADLRGADLRGADVSAALFLTVLQVRAARTDATTLLPAWAQG